MSDPANTDKAAEAQSASTSTFVTALITGLITIGGFSAFWLLFHGRKNLKRVFQPRIDLAARGEKPDELPPAPQKWWHRIFTAKDTEILRVQGPDAYFFMRYIKVFGLEFLIPAFLITFAVLLPVAAYKPNSGKDGLNMFTIGNIPANNQYRYIAFLLVGVILICYTLYLIWREYNHFADVRLQWFRTNRSTAMSRTVALVNVPDQYNTESGLRELASAVAGGSSGSNPRPSVATEGTVVGSPKANANINGGVTSVWISHRINEVEKVWEERDKECTRLEGGIGKLLTTAQKNKRKGKTPEDQGSWAGESIVNRYVAPKKQPKWKQGFLGLFGNKMNLETSPPYIRERNVKLEELRAKKDDYPTGNVSFMRFSTQEEAHYFARHVRKADKKLMMMKTSIEVVPEDIVWSNISMNPVQRKGRSIISWALTITLIIFWAIPVAAVGTISNIDTLKNKKAFSWLQKIPDVPLGIIKGLLPTILITVLYMLLPIVLRLWIKLGGTTRKSEIEFDLFTRFWLFWVINGFIVMSIAGGLISALGDIDGTVNNVPTLLAEKFPGASLFFLTFVMVNNWTGAIKTLSRAIPFVMYQLRFVLAGGTPRKVYNKKWTLDSFLLSTTWPPICLTMCISLVYSIVQPFITLIALVAFVLLYAAYKYQFLYTANQDPVYETGGMYYIKALRTVFVSLYIELCMLCFLFFLSTDDTGKRSKVGLAGGAIFAVLLVATAAFQIYLDWVKFKRSDLYYGPPNRAANTSYEMAYERTEDLLEKGGQDDANDMSFYHPAMWKKQPCIWIADDPLGLGEYEADRINSEHVEASTQFAHMNEKGQIDVDRSPPDEEWKGGV